MCLCIAKNKGVDLPSSKEFENCLKYNRSFGIAFFKDGVIKIHRNLNKQAELEKIINNNNIGKEDSFIIKIYYSTDTQNEAVQPLVVTNDFSEMVNTIASMNKSVIVFNKQPSGIHNSNKKITNQMIFTKMMSNFNFFDNKKLFNLAVGDNRCAIMDSYGNIHLYGCGKDNWKENNGVYYTDDDYKSYYSNNNCYHGNYSSYYYDDYDGYNYYNNNCGYNNKKCCICNTIVNTTSITVNKKVYCSFCYNKSIRQKKNTFFTCKECRINCDNSLESKIKNTCTYCYEDLYNK